jgi:hypothetical protein
MEPQKRFFIFFCIFFKKSQNTSGNIFGFLVNFHNVSGTSGGVVNFLRCETASKDFGLPEFE